MLKKAIELHNQKKYKSSLALLNRLSNHLFADYLNLYRLKNYYRLGHLQSAKNTLNGLVTKKSPLKDEALLLHLKSQKPGFFTKKTNYLPYLNKIDDFNLAVEAHHHISKNLHEKYHFKKAFKVNQAALKLFSHPVSSTKIPLLSKILKQSIHQLKKGNFYKKINATQLVTILLYCAIYPGTPKYDNLIFNIQRRVPVGDITAYRLLVFEYFLRKKKLGRAKGEFNRMGKLKQSKRTKFLFRQRLELGYRLALKLKDNKLLQQIIDSIKNLEKEKPSYSLYSKQLALNKKSHNFSAQFKTYQKMLRVLKNGYLLQKHTRDFFLLLEQNKKSMKVKSHINKVLRNIPVGTYVEEILYLGTLVSNSKSEKKWCLRQLEIFHPFSFFLRKLRPAAAFYVTTSSRAFLQRYPKPNNPAFRRGTIFEKIGLYPLAAREYNRSRSGKKYEIRTLMTIADLYEKEKRYKEAVNLYEHIFNLIAKKERNLNGIPSLLWHKKFPRHFLDQIHYWGRKYNVKAPLTLAIIREESRFDRKAVSRSWARGLMQLMSRTARWIQKTIQTKVVPRRKLFQANLNIKLGVWYLNHLKSNLTRQELVICAYNGGPGNVAKWLQKDPHRGAKILEFWKKIPLPETKRYLYKVMTSLNTYKAFYF